MDVTRDLEPMFETFRESHRKRTDGRTSTQASHLWRGFRIVLSPKNMFSWCEAGDHIENVASGTLFSFFGFGDGSTSLWNLPSSSCDKNQPWNWSFTLGGWRIKQSSFAVTMLRYWVKTHSALAAGENALDSACYPTTTEMIQIWIWKSTCVCVLYIPLQMCCVFCFVLF